MLAHLSDYGDSRLNIPESVSFTSLANNAFSYPNVMLQVMTNFKDPGIWLMSEGSWLSLTQDSESKDTYLPSL